jgi:tetratricopeptide (TPR) repeat protein
VAFPEENEEPSRREAGIGGATMKPPISGTNMPQRTKTLIAFATAWGSRFGGINSFNADFLDALAAAFFSHLRTVCVVLHATPEEVDAAQRDQDVTLVSLGLKGQKGLGSELEPLAWSRLQAALGPWNITDTVWLGHVRITGAIAIQAAQTRGGKSALIHHMSYERYEAFAENSAAAYEKEAEQKSLFQQATYAMAVGPLLQEALADMLGKEEVPCLIPGLAEIDQHPAPKKFKAFLSGRLHADAQKIKQAQLGLAGFGHAVYLCDQTPAYPDALKGKNEPGMLLRGVDFEHTGGQTSAEVEQDIKQFVERFAHRAVGLKLLPFTQNREALFEDLRSASVAMMPSWHEGFGLVAWEAIAAGVPLIVSKKSGVYKFLKNEQAGLYKGFVQAIDIQGTSVAPDYFTEQDKDAIGAALIEVAKNSGQWRQKSQKLREALLRRYTWTHCAQQFVNAIGWQLQAPTPNDAGPASTRVDEKALGQAVEKPPVINKEPPPSPLVNWLEMPLPTWQAAQGRSISQLLRAEEAVVPFDPQHQPFLDEQLAWAKATTLPLALRLLTGQGGTGKTRLALELCSQLAIAGWQTGFLRSECEARSMPDLAKKLAWVSQGGQAICVVVDYAETRQNVLLKLLVDLQTLPREAPIRFLLLARDGGEWWAQLPAQEPKCESLLLGAAATGPYVLPPLHDNEASRQAAYQTALQAFARQLNMALPMGLPTLQGEHFAHPLYVQMAALMALHGEKPQSAQGLARAIVNHESRYWHHTIQNLAQANALSDAAKLMTLATLASGFATVRDVEKLWKKAGGSKGLLRPLWQSLCPLYPGRQGLQGLHPDLLGEALVAQSLLSAAGQELLSAMLGLGSSTQRQSCLTVLARLLRQRDDIAAVVQATLTEHFAACAEDLCEVCVATPSPLAELAVASFVELPRTQQYQVTDLLAPVFQHEVLPLTSLAVAVGQAQCEKLAPKHGAMHNSLDKQQEWGQALCDLAVDYYRNGSNSQALKTGEKARDVFARLVEHDKRFEPDYAMSLSNYAVRLSENGREAEALNCAKQALDIHQRLMPLEPDCADSLNNYAIFLSANGRKADALDSVKQALDIYKRLIQHEAEAEIFEPNFAKSLSNYANRLSENDRDEEALKYSAQALVIHQRLAGGNLERFEPDYARSLGNYASHLSKNGRQAKAFECSKQSQDIYKRLAQQKPERFEPDYAMSLNNYALMLAEQGNYLEAVVHAAHAHALYLPLAKRLPLRYADDEYDARLSLALWRWLENGQDMGGVLAQDVPELAARTQCVALFQRGVWQCLNAAANQAGTQTMCSYSESALAQWQRMDAGQQQSLQELFLLFSALIHHLVGADAAPQAWQEQLERFRKQRQGRLPQWMQDAATRCGFVLGE